MRKQGRCQGYRPVIEKREERSSARPNGVSALWPGPSALLRSVALYQWGSLINRTIVKTPISTSLVLGPDDEILMCNLHHLFCDLRRCFAGLAFLWKITCLLLSHGLHMLCVARPQIQLGSMYQASVQSMHAEHQYARYASLIRNACVLSHSVIEPVGVINNQEIDVRMIRTSHFPWGL